MKYIRLFDVTPNIGTPLGDGKLQPNKIRMEMFTTGQGMTNMHGVSRWKPWRSTISAMQLALLNRKKPLPCHVFAKAQAVNHLKHPARTLPMLTRILFDICNRSAAQGMGNAMVQTAKPLKNLKLGAKVGFRRKFALKPRIDRGGKVKDRKERHWQQFLTQVMGPMRDLIFVTSHAGTPSLRVYPSLLCSSTLPCLCGASLSSTCMLSAVDI